jgi:alpha,alpha-trehalase
VLSRDVRFRDAEGRTTRWRERRIVSMADAHLAGLSVELTAEDWSGRLTVRSGLDGSVVNSGVARYRDLASRHLEIGDWIISGPTRCFLRCRPISR